MYSHSHAYKPTALISQLLLHERMLYRACACYMFISLYTTKYTYPLRTKLIITPAKYHDNCKLVVCLTHRLFVSDITYGNPVF
jgi:hypothetical protein